MAASDECHTFKFFGDEIKVTVTKTSIGITNWIRDVLIYHQLPTVVGVGVQWTKYDRVGGSLNVNAPPQILQLCVGNKCLIIQLGYLDEIPYDLRCFLTDEKTSFVGFRNPDDARKLSQSRHNLEIRQLRDIRNYLPDPNVMFQQIVATCMGYRGRAKLDPEEDPFINWSVNDLELPKIRQASIEAYVCSTLGFKRRIWEL